MDKWYYVQKGNRHGPVAIEVIEQMIKQEDLRSEDYVWKKGFENWKKIKDTSELVSVIGSNEKKQLPEEVEKEFSLSDFSEDERVHYVRVGSDRGTINNDYGPFNLKQLKQLFKENRINAKTLVFIKGSKNWKMLADFNEYEEIFEEVPPMIKDSDRRFAVRKPIIARLFVQNNKALYEGICRDISVGGMQILVDNFKGMAGDKISVNVHPENTSYHFTASGVVVRILEGNSGFSFRFNALSEEAKRAIEKYIQEN